MARKTQHLQVVALQALVICMYAAMLKRDPELVREIVTDEGLTDIENMPDLDRFPARDKKALQEIVDALLRPIRTALGEVPPFVDKA